MARVLQYLLKFIYRNEGSKFLTFEKMNEKWGLTFEGWSNGCLYADLDNDGDQDLYVNNFGPNVLYRNNGDGTFTDVTTRAGVGNGNQVGAGACFLDMDKDGDLDLFVSNYVGPNTLYLNDGDGRFTEAAEDAGLADGGWGKGPTFGDLDLDGDALTFADDAVVAQRACLDDTAAVETLDDTAPLGVIGAGAKMLLKH